MDGILHVDIETAALLGAMEKLGREAETLTARAAEITADNIVRDAQARVARRTGATSRGIEKRWDYGHVGFVVVTTDVIRQKRTLAQAALRYATPHKQRRWMNATYEDVPHVGLYLEYGTRHETARPFFWASARLEEAAHERRIRDALQQAIDQHGLGE